MSLSLRERGEQGNAAQGHRAGQGLGRARIQIQSLSSTSGSVALEEGSASALLWRLLGGKWARAVRGPGYPFELPFFCTWSISGSGSSACLLCHGVLVPTIGSLILGWRGRWQKGPSSGKMGLIGRPSAATCWLDSGSQQTHPGF